MVPIPPRNVPQPGRVTWAYNVTATDPETPGYLFWLAQSPERAQRSCVTLTVGSTEPYDRAVPFRLLYGICEAVAAGVSLKVEGTPQAVARWGRALYPELERPRRHLQVVR